MCYFINLKVISEKPKQVSIPQIPEVVFQREMPEFVITDGHCSCDFLTRDGTQLSLPDGLLEHFLIQKAVKRIEIRWYWGEPENVEVKKLTLSQFWTLNSEAQLFPNTQYRITVYGV